MTIPGLVPQIPVKCPCCKGILRDGGPLWLGKLQDSEYIKRMLDILASTFTGTYNNSLKLLERCYDESGGPATFYDVHKICKVLKISAPSLTSVLEELQKAGYFASRTHVKPTGIKTDAPLKEIKNIILNLK
jgi:tRNA (guanine26-N2/guanine27-N2)-dimethyltransferase